MSSVRGKHSTFRENLAEHTTSSSRELMRLSMHTAWTQASYVRHEHEILEELTACLERGHGHARLRMDGSRKPKCASRDRQTTKYRQRGLGPMSAKSSIPHSKRRTREGIRGKIRVYIDGDHVRQDYRISQYNTISRFYTPNFCFAYQKLSILLEYLNSCI